LTIIIINAINISLIIANDTSVETTPPWMLTPVA
jgi:hypothetical protein